MDNPEEDVRLTSFRPLSPDTPKSTFSLARFFQRKRPEAGVTNEVDSSTKQPSINLQLPNRGSVPSTRNPDQRSSFTSAPPIGPRTNYLHGGQVVGGRKRHPSSAGSRNVHAVLGRLNAAAGGRGQVRIHV